MPPPRAARYGLPLRALDAIRIRRPERADARAIADLLNAHSVEHHGEPKLTVAEIEHWLEFDAYVFWVAESADELLAYADVAEESERTRYWIDLRALEPDGARALLGAVEEWISQRAAPGALVRGVLPAPDETVRGIYESAGFRLVRYDLEMRIDLAEEPPEPSWPQGVTVRVFQPGVDDERTWAAANDAFLDHWEFTPEPLGRWQQRILEQPGFDPSLVFLAFEGEELAGLALAQVREAGEPMGWVQILGVRRPWRRRGLGLALLHHAFRELRAGGVTRAGLEVDAESLTGAVRLYERAGMAIAAQSVIYEKAYEQPAR